MLVQKNIFSDIYKFKNRIALYTKDYEVIKYSQILNDINIFKNYFQSKKTIMILAENTYEFIVCYIAAIRFNQLIILVNPNIDPNDLLNLNKSYSPEYLFCKNKIIPPKNFNKIFNFRDFSFFKNNNKKKFLIHKNLSCLLSTSGTTGSSKFAKISIENLLHNSKGISKLLKISPNDTSITTMPPFYSYALSILNTHLMNGSKIILNDYSLVDRSFWNLFEKFQPNNLNGVPYTYEILERIKFHDMSLSNLKYITQAGGKLKQNLKEKLIKTCAKKKIKFYIMYGQTEASPRITIMPWNLLKKFPDSVGAPLPGGKIKISNKIKSDNLLQGEIIYYGKNVFWGYSKSCKDLNEGNKVRNILKTGDLGYLDKKGLLYVNGRKKRILKIFGIRISLDLLETELYKNNYNCICAGTDEKLIVYLKKNKKISFLELKELIKKITNLMPRFFEIITIKDFKRNKIGKITYI
jgi:acyl-CoA synthetase (AMP-forming)/AMP-acid ligase II